MNFLKLIRLALIILYYVQAEQHVEAELGGGGRVFIPGRKILEGVIFVIINN
jgi:hypothetical protein